jgi:hypothetical protein
MQGGHFCAGSTIANLTGIWASRDAADVKTVVTSQAAHLSVEKACRLLHLEFVKVAGRSEDNASTGSRLIGEMTMPETPSFRNKVCRCILTLRSESRTQESHETRSRPNHLLANWL